MSALIDRIWRRHRRAEVPWSPDETAATWQLCSLLLDYPSEDLLVRMPSLKAVAAALPEGLGDGLTAYLDEFAAVGLGEMQQNYVETFDVTRKCALHLTYATCGDTRRRGVALVQFKQVYRANGVKVTDEDAELPDYLPVVLEFGALTDLDAGYRLLTDHRVSIELLHRALARRQSRWLPVVESLRSTLPALDGTDEEALAALIAAGPPTEDVGLEGYAAGGYAMDPALDFRPDADLAAMTPGPTELGATIPVGASR